MLLFPLSFILLASCLELRRRPPSSSAAHVNTSACFSSSGRQCFVESKTRTERQTFVVGAKHTIVMDWKYASGDTQGGGDANYLRSDGRPLHRPENFPAGPRLEPATSTRAAGPRLSCSGWEAGLPHHKTTVRVVMMVGRLRALYPFGFPSLFL